MRRDCLTLNFLVFLCISGFIFLGVQSADAALKLQLQSGTATETIEDNGSQDLDLTEGSVVFISSVGSFNVKGMGCHPLLFGHFIFERTQRIRSAPLFSFKPFCRKFTVCHSPFEKLFSLDVGKKCHYWKVFCLFQWFGLAKVEL